MLKTGYIVKYRYRNRIRYGTANDSAVSDLMKTLPTLPFEKKEEAEKWKRTYLSVEHRGEILAVAVDDRGYLCPPPPRHTFSDIEGLHARVERAPYTRPPIPPFRHISIGGYGPEFDGRLGFPSLYNE